MGGGLVLSGDSEFSEASDFIHLILSFLPQVLNPAKENSPGMRQQSSEESPSARADFRR